MRFGGEASLPLHYFSRLRARGVDAWLIVHGRTREEIERLFPDDRDRIYFVADRWFHKLLWRLGSYLPRRVCQATFDVLIVLVNQYIQLQIIRDMVAEHQINVVHQPIPVSPRAPSLICGLGVPVIIGPMNGGMEYPAAFRGSESWVTRISVASARRCANFVNSVFQGKKLADIVLVANQRTRQALPACVRGQIVELPENGVDLDLWSISSDKLPTDAPPSFVFIGRLVDWKRLDIAIRALARVPGAHLEVIGDGPMRSEWTALAANLGLSQRVSFLGWLPQRECAKRMQPAAALLLPSVYECGGAVVLEAMAMGTPSIATAWGGPADYIDPRCGIVIPPTSEGTLVDGFTHAMRSLISNPALRKELGDAGRKRVEELYDWNRKIDRLLQIYRGVLGKCSAKTPSISPDESTREKLEYGNLMEQGDFHNEITSTLHVYSVTRKGWVIDEGGVVIN